MSLSIHLTCRYPSLLGDETISLQEEYLPLHAKVYSLAEEYEVSGLKQTALRNFGFLLPRTISPHTFASAAEIAYTTVIESDRGLRDKVLKALYDNVKFWDDPAVKALFKRLPDLTYEFLLHRHECDKEAAASRIARGQDHIQQVQPELRVP